MPFNKVLERMRESSKVIPVPSTSSNNMPVAAASEPPQLIEAAKNMVRIVIMAGNRPLQGIQTLVRMAMSRSLGESMMRQPVTPAALHPNPMHMGICWANVLLRSLCNHRGVTLLCECQKHMRVGIADCLSQSRLNAIFFACFFSDKTIVNFDGLMFDFSVVCLFIISLTNFNVVNEFK